MATTGKYSCRKWWLFESNCFVVVVGNFLWKLYVLSSWHFCSFTSASCVNFLFDERKETKVETEVPKRASQNTTLAKPTIPPDLQRVITFLTCAVLYLITDANICHGFCNRERKSCRFKKFFSFSKNDSFGKQNWMVEKCLHQIHQKLNTRLCSRIAF